MAAFKRSIRLYPVVGLRRNDSDRLEAFVRGALAETNLDPTYGFAAITVAEELSTNVLEHSDAEWLEVEIQVQDQDLSVLLRDNGSSFDPRGVLRRFDKDFILEDQTERRLGLYVVRQLAKEIAYELDANGHNVLRVSVAPDAGEPSTAGGG